ncbi:MAG TPA: hypothetical protein VGE07_14680 [Herpetosiphonaceae bacterium]
MLLAASLAAALLLARVAMLLLAANPAHPFVLLVARLTEPLVAPAAWIDASQPRFGARFERGTLLLACMALAAAAFAGRRAPSKEQDRG